MAQTPFEVKQTIRVRTPDAWQSFRGEIDRLFDRFAGGFDLPAYLHLILPSLVMADRSTANAATRHESLDGRASLQGAIHALIQIIPEASAGSY